MTLGLQLAESTVKWGVSSGEKFVACFIPDTTRLGLPVRTAEKRPEVVPEGSGRQSYGSRVWVLTVEWPRWEQAQGLDTRR